MSSSLGSYYVRKFDRVHCSESPFLSKWREKWRFGVTSGQFDVGKVFILITKVYRCCSARKQDSVMLHRQHIVSVSCVWCDIPGKSSLADITPHSVFPMGASKVELVSAGRPIKKRQPSVFRLFHQCIPVRSFTGCLASSPSDCVKCEKQR